MKFVHGAVSLHLVKEEKFNIPGLTFEDVAT